MEAPQIARRRTPDVWHSLVLTALLTGLVQMDPLKQHPLWEGVIEGQGISAQNKSLISCITMPSCGKSVLCPTFHCLQSKTFIRDTAKHVKFKHVRLQCF